MHEFHFAQFTPLQRAFDVAGLTLMVLLLLAGIVLLITAVRRSRSGTSSSPVAALRLGLLMFAGGLVFLVTTQLEGAQSLTVGPDDVTIQYRFRRAVTVPLDSISAVGVDINRVDRGSKGSRNHRTLSILHDGRETVVAPLANSAESIEHMHRAAALLSERLRSAQ